ncbi:MAG TPA: adenylate kinase [Anaerolineae bacterium]|nr:adenylate kinase [Anaerolineae bacterium]
MATYLILLGAPGAGKGTQAERLSQTLKVPHISSGNIFRENLKNQTELGQVANRYISEGHLVPDDITIAMIKERLERPDCARGALLDGFPRTPAQAESLESILAQKGARLEVVLYIKVPQETLIHRLSGRWMCRAENHVFHEEFNPPQIAGVCDYDGSELFQREDDQKETVTERIRVYLEQTAPLINHYRQKGLLVEVDGNQSIDEVTEALMAVLSVGANR